MNVKIKKRSGQTGESNLVQKTQKFHLFLRRQLAKKKFREGNYFNTPLNQILNPWLVQKYSNSRLTLMRGLKDVASTFYEIQKLKIFCQKRAQKYIQLPKAWNMLDGEPSQCLYKIRLKSTNRWWAISI